MEQRDADLLPNPAQCRYLSRPEVEPVLDGCKANSCISWSASHSIGFGDHEDKKTRQLREIAAWEYFALYKKYFMEKYATRTPVVPRKQPQPFLLVARRARFDDDDEIPDGGMPTGPMKRAPRTLRKYRKFPRNPAYIDAEIAHFEKRPRRMEQLRVPRFPDMLTSGNPLTTAYGKYAPGVPGFVTRAEIITKPFGAAAKAMAWVIEEDDAAKNAWRFGRALRRVQTSISAKFAL
ncbi:hypothetical protein QQX98_010456 [Neonectria punicea]|uniref:Uncharacterized protein n=1 Tax=Neonectria punicea TaxID=979145 RepID=A0ABR1GPE1_9HYPO